MAMPPTLGDRLDDRMWSLGEDAAEVAAIVGATPLDVERWAEDADVPGPAFHWALAEYLGVDVAEIKRLVLRTQMRMVQRPARPADGAEAAGF